MAWDDLLGHYSDFVKALQQARIAAAAARRILRDFPTRLPIAEQRELEAGWQQMGLSLAKDIEPEIKAGKKSGVIESTEVPFPADPPDALVSSVLLLYMCTLVRNEGEPGLKAISFDRLMSEQELVVAIAQLDAFLSACVREMCTARPELLRSGKVMTREDMLAAGSWDLLLAQVVDNHVFDFGVEPLARRVRALRERYGLRITLTDPELKDLQDVESVRHLVLHNGGRVSQEFIRRTGRQDLPLNDRCPIAERTVSTAHQLSWFLAADVLFAIGEKYFEFDDPSSGTVSPRLIQDRRRAPAPGNH